MTGASRGVGRPNTFIVGAPKCGTTAMSTYMREHPQVFFSTPKELNYFNREETPLYRRRAAGGKVIDTEAEYLAYFSGAGPNHRAVAEGTVWYLFYPSALRAIKEFSPTARALIMLRSPVDMAVSLHAEEVASFEEDVPDFAAAWDLQKVRAGGVSIPRLCQAPRHLQYREVCSLGTQLESAFAVLGRSHCMPILLDDLAADPSAVWSDVQRFLGLDDDRRTSFPRVNERRAHRLRWLSLITLARPPMWVMSAANGLKRRFGLESLGVRPLINRLNVKQAPRPELPAELRRRLVVEFSGEIDRLERLLDRDLTRWRACGN